MKENKKKEQKRKPKYSAFSNVIYSCKKIWGWNKFIALSGILTIPLSLIMYALNLYTPSVIVDVLGTEKVFTNIIIVIVILLLINFTFKALNTIIDSIISTSETVIVLHMMYETRCKMYDMDYYLTYEKEIKDKETNALKAAENNHAAGVHFPMYFSRILYQVLGFIIFGTVISFINPLLIVIIISGAIINYIIYKWEIDENAKTWRKNAKTNKKINYLTYHISWDYNCGKDVRLFGMADYFAMLIKKLMGDIVKEHYETEKRSFIKEMINFILVLLRDSLAYYFLIKEALNGTIRPAEFVLYFAAIASLSEVLTNMINTILDVHKGSIQVSDYREYFEIKDRLNRKDGIGINLDLPYSIEFKNVSFKYPSAPDNQYVLKNINLFIKPGEKLAIVGLNGTGKTTLTMLICGLLLPTSGEVLLNNHSIFEYNRDDLYSLFGLVPQNYHLLPLTIEDNICLNHKKDYERLKYCLDISGLNEKVASLNKGTKTLINKQVNQDGIDLSGGEIQKLLLARSIYNKHAILILDEPTASLDPIAESEMYQKYNEISKNTTSIFISHRLASTRFCDRIILIQDHILKEIGSHNELIKYNGEYKKLFDVQSKYYKEVTNNE